MSGPAAHEQPAPVSLAFEAPIPDLVDGMDEEELAITVGLGLVAREAAAVEYVLHGIYVHLNEVDKAYTKEAGATGGQLVMACRKTLAKLDDSKLPASCRASLERYLDASKEEIDTRNRLLHGYWCFDEQRQSWLTLKGSRDLDRPEIVRTDSVDVWELASRLRRLYGRLVDWDIAHFGELAEDEDGSEGWVSVKHD